MGYFEGEKGRLWGLLRRAKPVRAIRVSGCPSVSYTAPDDAWPDSEDNMARFVGFSGELTFLSDASD